MTAEEIYNILCFFGLIASVPWFWVAIEDGEMWPLRIYVLIYFVMTFSMGAYLYYS